MITIRGLTIGYDGVPILEGLDFDVPAHEVFVILGGSGCGKSTLLRHLIGLQAPMAGTIRIDEAQRTVEVPGTPRFGVTFQAGALFSSMTLQENAALPLLTWTDLEPDAIAAIALARLRLVGLGGFENHLPAETSGGMRKRAAIARALALDPELLFLDEPSAGLDPISAVELDDLIRTLRDDLGVTTVIVTHELESIFRIGDRCIMLDRDARGIIARGDPRELRERSTDPRVHRFFNRLPAVI
jgi:phospholipid/cholesterol/gamma-HCH transport system ATP-binding protein